MTTKKFLTIAPKLEQLGIYTTNLKKGQHGKFLLGMKIFGSTEAHYKIIWRKYGTLENLTIFDTAERVNEKLKTAGITEFIAKQTKGGHMCRLYNNF